MHPKSRDKKENHSQQKWPMTSNHVAKKEYILKEPDNEVVYTATD